MGVRVKKQTLSEWLLEVTDSLRKIEQSTLIQRALSLYAKQRNKALDRRDANRAQTKIEKLVREGLLAHTGGRADLRYSLTEKGKSVIRRLKIKQIELKKTKWDGMWRIFSFDIAELRRERRTLLRKELKRLGFVLLQHSVWVTPYPCDDFYELLKAELSLGKEIIYITASRIEGDQKLRKQFGLNQK